MAAVVTMLAAFVFGVLSRLSPKDDWEFIKNGPWWVIFCLNMALDRERPSGSRTSFLAPGPPLSRRLRGYHHMGRRGDVHVVWLVSYQGPTV